MKLLKKSVLTNELASERKKQIDEGIALATRIDGLRRTLTEVEAQHNTYISKMKEKLKEETQPLFEQVNSLKAEIEHLEIKRIELRIPLNKEWDTLKVAQKDLELEKDYLNKELAKARDSLQKNIILGKKIKDRLILTKIRERELIKANSKTDEINSEIIKIRDSLSIGKLEFDKLIEESNKAILSEYASIEVKYRELKMAQDKLEQEKKDIINQKILLIDREETLEREIKRNGKLINI